MRIETVLGDITKQDVDVVVNAANSSLLGGGGVDGAIHAAAGPRLLDACRELRADRLPDGLPVGHAVATDGFDLPARWVVHTVGPNWHAGERDTPALAACFLASLEVAVDLGAHSIAFPAISAGAYGWDVEEVADVAVHSVRAWQAGTDQDRGPDGRPHGIALVHFVLFSPQALAAFDRALAA
ncbi:MULTISPECIES: O-acetyl-ADP-ribose deacetylase [Cellulomonas]|uniref:O-acetyl-ADP-ribose deacetylase n=1 Tax=Cellulomonas gelida TaxID=1712 RepID=A0A4Y3KQ24_9CELL|nr:MULTISPECIES: O-acetyl-ADP-ribose deacetylase [Cellulomonas]MCR6704633.1 O-acetyl-ADP-ribose deacetylase [Cellulomonas sp.]GEA86023.1 O-acetyl-ADP-ribose deacetylase [Cellulomonas gelida]GGL33442.1 O-acetyl-ADP-ribose deacetylase [Cellulomonas gelida]